MAAAQVPRSGSVISKLAIKEMLTCRLSGPSVAVVSAVATAQTTTHERLLTITDEGLTAFELPSLALKAQAHRTRGGTHLAWSVERSAAAVAKSPSLGTPPGYAALFCIPRYQPPCFGSHPNKQSDRPEFVKVNDAALMVLFLCPFLPFSFSFRCSCSKRVNVSTALPWVVASCSASCHPSALPSALVECAPVVHWHDDAALCRHTTVPVVWVLKSNSRVQGDPFFVAERGVHCADQVLHA
jgi:hypothetical protein